MATNTYVALNTQTLLSPASNVVFSSIPQTYTDLVLVVSARDTRTELNDGFALTFNTDTSTGSTNYSDTYLYGASSSRGSGRNTNVRNINIHQVTGANVTSTKFGVSTTHIMNYSNTTTYKTVLNYGGVPVETYGAVGLWRNTAAISTITVYPGYNGSGYSFSTGSTFTLYGVSAEGVSPAAKATGGTIYSDDTYYYHVFTSTGVFTPLQSLTCGITATGGGGGGGFNNGGGGGGAELKINSSLSVTAQAYAVTIGGGGSGATSTAGRGGTGTSSTITIGGTTYLTALGGGGGGTSDASSPNGSGGTGGSGGGGSINNTAAGGSPSGDNTFAGGGGAGVANNYSGGGGGGATAAGVAGTTSPSKGGNGGEGYSTANISGVSNIFGTAQIWSSGGGGGNYSGTRGFGGTGAGNGGSSGSAAGQNATTYGSGGGGGSYPDPYRNGGAGASGILIIRYTKA